MADGRVTQETVEVVILPTDANVRVTQAAVETVILPTNQLARVTQIAIEVIISIPSGRIQSVQQC